jgi:hypothetical protein
MGPAVIEWVRLNREDILRFWSDGDGWTFDEVNVFVDGLRKVP